MDHSQWKHILWSERISIPDHFLEEIGSMYSKTKKEHLGSYQQDVQSPGSVPQRAFILPWWLFYCRKDNMRRIFLRTVHAFFNWTIFSSSSIIVALRLKSDWLQHQPLEAWIQERFHSSCICWRRSKLFFCISTSATLALEKPKTQTSNRVLTAENPPWFETSKQKCMLTYNYFPNKTDFCTWVFVRIKLSILLISKLLSCF